MKGVRSTAVAIALAAGLASGGCVVPIGVPGAPPPPPEPAVPEGAYAEIAAGVIDQANLVRRDHGLVTLVADAALNRAALGHAQELARRRTLDHLSVDRTLSTPADRVTAAGASWNRVGENLAGMSGPASRVPRRSVNLWLGSPDHRLQLLGTYTHTGAGVAVSDDGHYYVVQLYTVPAPGGR
jgi:uncharacterized protein YkwD